MTGILRTAEIFIFVTILLKGTFPQNGAPVRVLVHQQATLFSNANSCEDAEFKRLLPTETTIATCQKQQCSIKEGLREKYKLEDNNLVLKSAKNTDWGTYECICNRSKTTVKWDVVVALNVTADSQGNITLLCFAKDAKDVTWFCNDTEILHGNITGFTIIDKGFQKRLSLNEGWFKDGNLSLTLLDVNKKDAGLYFCRVNDETTEGYPYAQMLHVNDANSSPGEKQADFRVAFIIAIIVILVLLVIIVVLSVALYKANRIIRSGAASQPTSPRTSQPAEESSENIPMLPAQHDESHSAQTVARPVQESEIDQKSSSTKPFFDRSGQ